MIYLLKKLRPYMTRFHKIIEYGLYLVVFLLPWQARLILVQGEMSGWPYEFSTISLYAIDILLLILLILNASIKFFSSQKMNDNIKIPLVWWLIAIIELMTFVSLFTAVNKEVAIQAYLRLLLGIGLFWLVVSVAYNRGRLMNIFLVSSAIQAFFGIWQFLEQKAFASTWLGVAKHLPLDIGASVITTLDGSRWLRAYGGLDHPNIFGGLMAIALLVIINKIICRDEKKEKINYAIDFFGICLLATGLFFSFSRAAWISFFFGLIIIGVVNFVQNKKRIEKVLLYIVLTLILVFSSLIVQYKNLVIVRVTDSTITESKSINERIASYEIAKELLKEHWVLGVGAGNYGLKVKNKMPDLEYYAYQPTHNVYLLVLLEIGVFGFIFYISTLIYIAYTIIKRGDGYDLSFIVCLMTMFFFDHWWWSLHFGVLFFWLLLGISYIKSQFKLA